ncbi:MAG: AmmeMemoRadiSam system radical SAM enzyme [Clostridiales bacterium]|jgi:pyruvate formate lyase activating enzyme|nr:AmmeMemoRadiSam system radical SAM enzyme [Clostridiales bacterium]
MDEHPASFYTEPESGAVTCVLCPHYCKIPAGTTGFCGIRKNIGGKLYASSYGKISGIALDPIEKKPLYMFYPGKRVLSIGGFGCNLRCPFCQNSDISINYKDALQEAEYTAPEDIAALAVETVPEGNIGVAYTYNEPLIGYEFVSGCAKLVHEAGLLNILVTNGYINRDPLLKLLPFIDAMNIDLKGFSNDFYKKLGAAGNVPGGLDIIKETITLSCTRCHVEVTTLIIPDENDSEEEIEALAQWLASLDPKIPLHLTRFFPRYKYSRKVPTARENAVKLSVIAKKYLDNVFTGNM